MADTMIDEEGFQLGEDNERTKDDEGNDIAISHDEENNILDEDGSPKMDDAGEAMKVNIYKPEPVVEPPVEPPEPSEIDKLNTKIEELTKANTGIRSDLESERGRRREATQAAPPAMTPEEQEEYLQEPMTRQEALNLQDLIRKDIKGAVRPLMESTSESSARKNHEDFDEVSKLADEVLKEQPYLKAALNLSDNPSEMKYTFGKTHPKYIEGITNKGKINTVKTITNPKINTSAKISGVGSTDLSGIDLKAATKLQESDPEAFAKLPQATRERIMGAF